MEISVGNIVSWSERGGQFIVAESPTTDFPWARLVELKSTYSELAKIDKLSLLGNSISERASQEANYESQARHYERQRVSRQ